GLGQACRGSARGVDARPVVPPRSSRKAVENESASHSGSQIEPQMYRPLGEISNAAYNCWLPRLMPRMPLANSFRSCMPPTTVQIKAMPTGLNCVAQYPTTTDPSALMASTVP